MTSLILFVLFSPLFFVFFSHLQNNPLFFHIHNKQTKTPKQHLLLWNTSGALAALVQEILLVYPLLSPPRLRNNHGQSLWNAMVLLQELASKDETQTLLVKSSVPYLLYPFLNTTSRGRQYEFLRALSLGVIGALVKTSNPQIIRALLSTELLLPCLRVITTGTETSKIISTFIVERFLEDEHGLETICQSDEFARGVLEALVAVLQPLPSVKPRLVKHALHGLERLSTCERLHALLAASLEHGQLLERLYGAAQGDEKVQQYLHALQANVAPARAPLPAPPLPPGYVDPQVLQQLQYQQYQQQYRQYQQQLSQYQQYQQQYRQYQQQQFALQQQAQAQAQGAPPGAVAFPVPPDGVFFPQHMAVRTPGMHH